MTATAAKTIAVIDYDMGNLHSACKGLERAGATTLVTDRYQDLAQADAVVLPGVGAFDPAMQHLRARDLVEPIRDVIASGKPFLGICLGLQILFEGQRGRARGWAGRHPWHCAPFLPGAGADDSAYGLEPAPVHPARSGDLAKPASRSLGLFCSFLLRCPC